VLLVTSLLAEFKFAAFRLPIVNKAKSKIQFPNRNGN
jgi:hypothetical protein